MAHIERNRCRIITKDDFQKHKAEQQIQQDAFEELQGTALHAGASSTTDSDIADGGGASLLEDQRVHIARDWQGAPENESLATDDDPYAQPASLLSREMSDLAIEKYPPLMANLQNTNTSKQTGDSKDAYSATYSAGDLMDPAENPQVGHGSFMYGNNNVWRAQRPDKAQAQSTRGPSTNLLDSTSSVNLLDSVVDRETVATRGTRNSKASGRTNLIPAAVRAENQDPNAPNAQVQSRVRVQMPTREKLQQYWSPIEGCYVCPGAKCGRKILSVQAFEEHLSSGVHAPSNVQCPCCFKLFKSTTALVAHAESGSTRCDLRKTEEFDLAMQQITAGLIRVKGAWSGAGNARFESRPIEEW